MEGAVDVYRCKSALAAVGECGVGCVGGKGDGLTGVNYLLKLLQYYSAGSAGVTYRVGVEDVGEGNDV